MELLQIQEFCKVISRFQTLRTSEERRARCLPILSTVTAIPVWVRKPEVMSAKEGQDSVTSLM